MEPDTITTEELVACVEREIGMREKFYPRWIKQKKLLPVTAEIELARMRAVRERLIKAEVMYRMVMRVAKEGHLAIGESRLEEIMEEEDAACRVRLYEAKKAG